MLLGGHVIHCTQIGRTNKIIRKFDVADNYEIPPRSGILLMFLLTDLMMILPKQLDHVLETL